MSYCFLTDAFPSDCKLPWDEGEKQQTLFEDFQVGTSQAPRAPPSRDLRASEYTAFTLPVGGPHQDDPLAGGPEPQDPSEEEYFRILSADWYRDATEAPPRRGLPNPSTRQASVRPTYGEEAQLAADGCSEALHHLDRCEKCKAALAAVMRKVARDGEDRSASSLLTIGLGNDLLVGLAVVLLMLLTADAFMRVVRYFK